MFLSESVCRYSVGMQSKATTVKQYLAELPPERRVAISAVRAVVRKNLPKGYEEGMQYGMIGYYVPHSLYPAGYHCDPDQPLPYVHIASQKNHMAVYLMCMYGNPKHEDWFVKAYAATGKRLNRGKSCVRFSKLENLALDVVGEMVNRVSVKELIAFYESAIENTPAARKVASRKRKLAAESRNRKKAAADKSKTSGKSTSPASSKNSTPKKTAKKSAAAKPAAKKKAAKKATGKKAVKKTATSKKVVKKKAVKKKAAASSKSVKRKTSTAGQKKSATKKKPATRKAATGKAASKKKVSGGKQTKTARKKASAKRKTPAKKTSRKKS